MDRGKAVSICDNAYCNGGDLELLAMLDADGRMLEVAGYAGWNTSANNASINACKRRKTHAAASPS